MVDPVVELVFEHIVLNAAGALALDKAMHGQREQSSCSLLHHASIERRNCKTKRAAKELRE